MNKIKILALSTLGLAMIPNAFAQTTQEQRVKQLERKVEALQAQQISAKSLADKIHFSGFATIAVGIADNDAQFAGYTDDKLDFKQDSVFGLQTDFEINDSTKATLQLLSRGSDDWKLNLQWAFLAHEFDNGIVLRGGKLQLPIYMISDFIEVGYAYPYIRPTLDVYDIGVPKSYIGGDISYSFDFDDFIINAQAYYGNDRIEVPGGVEAEMENLVGLKLNLEWESFTFGISKASASISGLEPSTGTSELDAGFTGFNFMFDNGDWLITSEMTFTDIDGMMPDSKSSYVMFSYNFSGISPYIALSSLETTDNEKRLMLPNNSLDIDRSVISVGVRYELMSNVALKFDWTNADKLKGTSGRFPGNQGYMVLPQGGVLPVNTGAYTETNVYSIVVDVIF